MQTEFSELRLPNSEVNICKLQLVACTLFNVNAVISCIFIFC